MLIQPHPALHPDEQAHFLHVAKIIEVCQDRFDDDSEEAAYHYAFDFVAGDRAHAGQKKAAMGRLSFKDEHSTDERKAESARMRQKYPERVPVIVERARGSDLPDMEKKKYLVPEDLTVGQFVYIVGKRLNLTAGEALFIFIGKVLPSTASLMAAMYNEYKDQDGFLYVTYSGEKTFG